MAWGLQTASTIEQTGGNNKKCSVIPHYIMADDHDWRVTINGIQTLLNIDE